MLFQCPVYITAVQWLALSPHSQDVLGFRMVFQGHARQVDSKLAVGVSMTVCGCLCFCDRPMSHPGCILLGYSLIQTPE